MRQASSSRIDQGAGATPIFLIEGAERQLFDGQRRTHVRIEHLSLCAGISYALCGPSGIGKTTALEMLSLARTPDVPGKMTLVMDGRRVELHALAARSVDALTRLRGRSFGYVVQTSHLFPYLSVRENIELPQKIAGCRDRAFVDDLMQALQIESLADVMPTRLSGGQRQRACVARSLAHRPTVVLADEPTSAVDQEVAISILDLLTGYAHQYSATVLIITHNTSLVRQFQLAPLDIHSRSSGGVLQTVISSPSFDDGAVLARRAQEGPVP